MSLLAPRGGDSSAARARQARAEERAQAIAAARGIDMSPEALRARQDAFAKHRIMERIAVGCARAHHSAVMLLQEYVLAGGTEDGKEVGLRYFAENGPKLPEEAWLGFADWYAARAVAPEPVHGAEAAGDVSKDEAADEPHKPTIAVRTLVALVADACEGMERLTAVKHLDKQSQARVRTFIQTTLQARYGLTTAVREKYVSTPADFRRILQEAQSNATLPFRCAEERLGFTTFTKLLTYTASRSSELVRTAKRQGPQALNEDGVATFHSLDAALAPDALRWRDLELFFLGGPEGRGVTIAAKMTIRLLKGHRANDGMSKRVVLTLDDEVLLCPIRDLLELGQLQGVWEESAEDMLRLLGGNTLKLLPGGKIPIRQKKTKTADFLFRKCTTTDTGEVCMVNEASTSTIKSFRKVLRLCATACGISDRTPATFHMFRRQGLAALNELHAADGGKPRKRARRADGSDGSSSDAASYADDASDNSTSDEADPTA